jgi:hypothetical protein
MNAQIANMKVKVSLFFSLNRQNLVSPYPPIIAIEADKQM